MANVPITSLPVATSLGPTTDYLEVSKYINAPGATYQSVRADFADRSKRRGAKSCFRSGIQHFQSWLRSRYGRSAVPHGSYNATITGATMVCAPTGSLTVDIWRTSYTLFDGGSTHPVVADSICGGNPLLISSGTKTTSTLANWGTSFKPGRRVGL